jgi:hypothetical protein
MQRRGPQAPPFGPVLHWMLCPFRRPAAPASAVRTDPGGAVQQAGKSARQDLEVAPKVDSPTQLAQQIRFGLSTLGENNAHHDFERLCHGLARRRITSNLIPPPDRSVAAGTRAGTVRATGRACRTSCPAPTSTFVALASGEKGHCCIYAEGVADEYRSGGWSHAEGRVNGSKPPMIDAIWAVQAPSGGRQGR